MLDSCIELLTRVTAQIDGMEKEVERAAMLTKRMLEGALPEPPLQEPTVVEPPLVETDIVRLRNAVFGLDTHRCRGSWSTQCTWLPARGRPCGTLDFERARDCSRIVERHGKNRASHTLPRTWTQIIFEVLNVHAMYMASLSCPVRFGTDDGHCDGFW